MCSPGVSYFCGQASAFSALPWKRGLPFYPHQSMLFKASAVSSSFSWKHWLSCTSHCWCTVDEGQCTLSLPPLSNGQNIWHCPWPIIWPVTVTSLKDSGERCHSKKKWKRRKREREEGVKKKKILSSRLSPSQFLCPPPLPPSSFPLSSRGVRVHVKRLLNWNIDVEYQSMAYHSCVSRTNRKTLWSWAPVIWLLKLLRVLENKMQTNFKCPWYW